MKAPLRGSNSLKYRFSKAIVKKTVAKNPHLSSSNLAYKKTKSLLNRRPGPLPRPFSGPVRLLDISWSLGKHLLKNKDFSSPEPWSFLYIFFFSRNYRFTSKPLENFLPAFGRLPLPLWEIPYGQSPWLYRVVFYHEEWPCRGPPPYGLGSLYPGQH